MKKKIIKLTESDLQRIIERVMNEDFGTKLVSRGKGLIASLKARAAGEGRDARQLIKAITMLKSTATQASPLLDDIKKDLDDLFKEKFMNKATNYNEKLQSNVGLEDPVENFKKELQSYQSLLSQLIEKNKMIQNLDLSSDSDNGVAV